MVKQNNKRIVITLSETRLNMLEDLCQATEKTKSQLITEFIRTNWMEWVISLPEAKHE